MTIRLNWDDIYREYLRSGLSQSAFYNFRFPDCKIHKKTYGIPKFSYGCFFEGTFGITPLRKLASMLR